MTAEFELEGQEFVALNGGPRFKFTEAISFVVNCETQEEVDYFWERLSEGGEKSRCGWLKDKFGLWWQVVPTILAELMGDKDPEKSKRVMQAMLQMDKIEIEPLKRAYEGVTRHPLALRNSFTADVRWRSTFQALIGFNERFS